MALHEQSVGATDEWYTPPHVFRSMGHTFDLDVASPGQNVTPWVPASNFLTALSEPDAAWSGFVWMNPPFGRRMGLVPWLEKFFAHGDGVALVPNRTTPWWDAFAPRADLTLQVSEKIKFYRPDGTRGEQPGTGTTLFAAGPRGVRALHNAAAAGLGTLWLNVKAAA
jgi:hypothetical protein